MTALNVPKSPVSGETSAFLKSSVTLTTNELRGLRVVLGTTAVIATSVSVVAYRIIQGFFHGCSCINCNAAQIEAACKVTAKDFVGLLGSGAFLGCSVGLGLLCTGALIRLFFPDEINVSANGSKQLVYRFK
jgi:hypothetical protein